MKKLLLATLLLTGSASAAMPSINHANVSGSDRVRTADGASCDQAINTGKSVTLQGYGNKGDNNYDYYDPMRGYGNTGNDVGIALGVSIQFGGADRVDCKRMYDNEMSRKETELKITNKEATLKIEQLTLETTRLRQLLKNKTHFSD